MKNQKDWDNFYLNICSLIAQQSYAEDRKVGAIIVKDDNIIAFSYNGTARGTDNDTQSNPVLHAEAQAIAKVARSNLSTQGSTLYCTLSPCIDCAKLIYACGIVRVVYQSEYKCLKGVQYLKDNFILVNEVFDPNKFADIEWLKQTGLL
ncbi:deoxycytidylate deaminase [Flavobacterium sp.]|jgi:dCMP deaminase|uniref:deoxycytidylate deaminase n=1 Tax=Flavobacterium sp. TaxID=239 RepID=UPI0037C0CF2B